MEEVKKQERTLEQVTQEYSQLCSKAGHAQYQIHVHTKDLELINKELRDLNFEAAAIQNKAKEEAAKAEEAPAEEAKPAEQAAANE